MCKKNFITFFVFVSAVICSSCQSAQKPIPQIVPAVEIKRDVQHPLGVIGEVELVYISPLKSAFEARIDTGAQTSSLDVDRQKMFERDGEKWVSFQITNRETGETKWFEKPVVNNKIIRRIDDNEKRVSVIMDIKMGDQIIKEEFSLAKRDKFNYQVLIGRNVLVGRAIVDPALQHTLK